jgi:arginine repressor
MPEGQEEVRDEMTQIIRDLKEQRIAIVQAVVARDFPNIHELPLDRQAQVMRRCENDPAVWAIEDQIRAARAAVEAS